MKQTESRRSSFLVNVLFFVIALSFSFYFTSLRFAKPEWEPVSLERMISGTAETPFQFRVLAPWILGWFQDHVLPLPGIRTARGMAFIIELLSTFFLVVAFRHYMGFFIKSRLLRSTLTLWLIAILPFTFLISRLYPFWMVFDMPSILFTMLGLILIYKRNWLVYYLLFFAATINRETTCFLTFVYLFTAWGRDRKVVLALHCAAQFLIWVAIKRTLMSLYGGNPGPGLALNQTMHNVHALIQPQNLAIILSTMAYIWIPVILLFRRIPDPFVRRACLVLPLFFVVMFRTGNLDEMRIYGDVIPIVLPAFLMLVIEMVKWDQSSAMSDRITG